MIEEEIALVFWVGETTTISIGLLGRSEGAREEASYWMQGKRVLGGEKKNQMQVSRALNP